MSSGTGYYCYGGKFRAVTWEKGNPEDPLRLKDENGAALQVNVGKSYVAIVGKDRKARCCSAASAPRASSAARARLRTRRAARRLRPNRSCKVYGRQE